MMNGRVMYVLPLLLLGLVVTSTHASGAFQGCFQADTRDFQESFNSIYNINSNCARHCQERGYIISVTQETLCACTQTLPVPQLARPEDQTSSGPSSECNRRCPGSRNVGQCYGDECCGGAHAYTVYVTGEIDAQLQIARRMRNNVKADPRYFYTRYFRFMETSGYRMDTRSQVLRVTKNENYIEDCEHKCLMLWNCDGYSWNIRTRECLLWANSHIGERDSNWVSNVRYYGFVRHLNTDVNSGASAIKTIKFKYFFDECEEVCIQTEGCTGYTWSDYELWCTLWRGATGFRDQGKRNFNAAVLSQADTNNAFVKTHATMITNNGDIYYRICQVRVAWEDESCYETDVVPTDEMFLDVYLVENQLEHSLGSGKEPYGTATETDNLFGSTTVTTSHTYQHSYSSSTTYSTESGTSMTTKTSSKTTVGPESMEEAITEKDFFTEGHSETTTIKYTESKTFELAVPPHCNGIMEVFTENYRLQIKWRTHMLTEGNVRLVLDGRERRIHVSQALTYDERKIYTFGTTDYGERTKLVAITKITDSNGDLVSESTQGAALQ